MKIYLKHKRVRCERVNGQTFLADDFDVVLLGSNTVVGSCELRYASIEVLPLAGNISYTVFEAYRGRGFATEAVNLLCEMARKNGMNEVWITCDSSNVASIGVCRAVFATHVDTVDTAFDAALAQRNVDSIERFRIRL